MIAVDCPANVNSFQQWDVRKWIVSKCECGNQRNLYNETKINIKAGWVAIGKRELGKIGGRTGGRQGQGSDGEKTCGMMETQG